MAAQTQEAERVQTTGKKIVINKQTHKTATHKGCLLIWAERSIAGDQSSSKTQNGPAAIIRSARNPTALLSAAQAGV